MSENIFAPDHDQDPGSPDPNLDREAAGTNIDEQPTGDIVEQATDRDAAPNERVDEHGIDTDHKVGTLDERREAAEEQAIRENNSLVDNAQDDGFRR